MKFPDLSQLEAAVRVVHDVLPPTPQIVWPLLNQHLGAEVWVKHENHTPVGAFKIRGGLVFFEESGAARAPGVIAATRGNHGQSVGFGARRHGVPAIVVAPHGNSREKNSAMRALGVELIEHGDDFQASLEYARDLAEERGLMMVPSFHPLLVRGVATYAFELLQAAPKLDVTYVPIGLGSGICGVLAAREALGARTEVVGVVSAHAPAYAESFRQRQPVERPALTRLADGMACRTPDPEALEWIWHGVDRVVEVTDEEVADAMRVLFESTHNVAEGAGAAALAAAIQERSRIAGRRVGIVLSGGNVDRDLFAEVLAGTTR